MTHLVVVSAAELVNYNGWRDACAAVQRTAYGESQSQETTRRVAYPRWQEPLGPGGPLHRVLEGPSRPCRGYQSGRAALPQEGYALGGQTVARLAGIVS